MGIQKTQYQGGSIVSFIIVTVLLAAVLVGGVIWLRQRGEVARQSDQTESSQEESATDDQANKTEESSKSGDDKSKEDSEDSDSTPAELPGASSEDESDDDGSVAVGSTGDDDKDGTNGESRGSGSTVPGQLPETGPAEVVIAAMATVALAYTSVRYVQSRRDLAQAVSDIA